MTVSANCKQVLTIAISVFLFDYYITFTNAIGILLTLIGGVSAVQFWRLGRDQVTLTFEPCLLDFLNQGWYGYIEYAEKNKNRVGRIMEKP